MIMKQYAVYGKTNWIVLQPNSSCLYSVYLKKFHPTPEYTLFKLNSYIAYATQPSRLSQQVTFQATNFFFTVFNEGSGATT